MLGLINLSNFWPYVVDSIMSYPVSGPHSHHNMCNNGHIGLWCCRTRWFSCSAISNRQTREGCEREGSGEISALVMSLLISTDDMFHVVWNDTYIIHEYVCECIRMKILHRSMLQGMGTYQWLNICWREVLIWRQTIMWVALLLDIKTTHESHLNILSVNGSEWIHPIDICCTQ